MQDFSTVAIQRITIKNLILLQEISIRTFTEAFSSTNNADNIAIYILEKFGLEQLTFEINNANSQFYFAFANDQVIGYIKLNSGDAQTENIVGNNLEIQRIYIIESFHGKKVGQLLLDYALQIALDAGFESVWLGVWEHNYKAIQFYSKNGFTVFDKHDFMMGNDKQTDLLMNLFLKT
ncbi:ribosomal protein S18 acetylase RimI-like enzyme [Flavobacterium sp. PL11]|uniref:GNAT family N-acetyltransferase n=1 Tax=Flavobacterium sp. PL11 TaxID=3071717 RepID=UPI002DFF0616|nr:ribosomal protein S18 acetylase RimI-like enzyme [Flavobacterium sp. PL11]